MLLNKLTFSLASLIVVFVLGLVAPAVMAQKVATEAHAVRVSLSQPTGTHGWIAGDIITFSVLFHYDDDQGNVFPDLVLWPQDTSVRMDFTMGRTLPLNWQH